MVGRSKELGVIDEALSEAVSGHGGTIFLSGEAGAGKTRLIQETAERARPQGLVLLSSAAPSTISQPPFGMLSRALRVVLRQKVVAPEELRGFAPGLRLVLPEWPMVAGEPNLSPEQLRLLALEGSLQLLLLSSGPSGSLLLFDDLHKSDPETLEFLHHASAVISTEPILILAAIRTGEDSRAETEARALVQARQATAIDISGLDVAATASLIGGLVGSAPPETLVQQIFASTDGNPLLVEELIEAMLRTGAIKRTDGRVDWSHPTRSVVPRSIVAQVRQRLAGLNADARRFVRAAAVLGRFETDLVGAMVEIPAQRVDEVLDSALASGGLLDQGLEIGFRHALIMEAVAQTVPSDQRQDLHLRASRAIEALRGDAPEWLEEKAEHLAAGNRLEEAALVQYAVARQHLARAAPVSAEATLRRALTLAASDDSEERLRGLLAETLGVLGRWEEALKTDQEYLDRGKASSDRLMRIARNAVMLGRVEAAEAYIDKARRAEGTDPGQLQALSALASLWRGDFARAIEFGRDALAAGEGQNDPSLICSALDVIGRASDEIGHRDDAMEAFQRWAMVAQSVGLTASYLQALMELGNVEFMRDGNPNILRETRSKAREAGAFVTLVLADLSLIWSLSARGELAEAIEAGEEAVGVCRRFRLDLLPFALCALAWARGRHLAGSGNEAAKEVLGGDPTDAAIEANEALADSALRTGKYNEAIRFYDESLALIRASPAPLPAITPFIRVAALLAAGHRQDALLALEEARGLPSRWRLFYNDVWFRAGEAMAAGAEAELELIVDGATNAEFDGAIALVLGAEIINGPRAEVWLRRAFRVFERAGAESDMARVRELLARQGARLQRARRRISNAPELFRARGVSSREAEILALVAKGLSNPEIAEQLFVSHRTVESHIAALFAKLDVHNRAGLIALAKDAGV